MNGTNGRLSGKVAIVTGAGCVGPGWGNGRAAAVLFAREGARVFAADNNAAAMDETVARIGECSGTVITHVCDVTKSDEVAACGQAAEAGYYRAVAEKMVGVIAEHGWDGAWFRRAYDHSGHAVGSAADDEGQIFIEPQGMCVMSGVGIDDGMAVRALDSVRERLATSHGILLLQPAYTRYHLELGEISSYPPGYKENGSVFCHTNPWVMIAEAMVGRGDAAFGYYQRINPSTREQISDVHRCEPYVYAQMIAGRDAPTQGEAKNSWLPAAWPGFTAIRRFRGATYQISVRNPDRISGRVTHLEVDGQRIEGTLVPLAPPGATVQVEAVAQSS